jgi:hypothetical protein
MYRGRLVLFYILCSRIKAELSWRSLGIMYSTTLIQDAGLGNCCGSTEEGGSRGQGNQNELH